MPMIEMHLVRPCFGGNIAHIFDIQKNMELDKQHLLEFNALLEYKLFLYDSISWLLSFLWNL